MQVDDDDEKVGRGRPTKYRPEYAQQAEKLCELGATDPEIADFFGVDVVTVYRWKLKHEDFCKALKVGKELCDDRVERALYMRATGYAVTEQQVIKLRMGDSDVVEIVEVQKQVAPDPSAAKLWLTNRRKETWRDKQEVQHEGNVSLNVKLEELDDETLAQLAAERLKKG